MKKKNCGEEAKVDRRTVEKNRRMHMKRLCCKLATLIPKEENQSSRNVYNPSDHLDQAASYIKELNERVEKLKQKKITAMKTQGLDKDINTGAKIKDFRLPVIEVRELDSVLEVVLVSKLDKPFMFHQVVAVLEEEGALVLDASSSVVGDKIFHTFHSQAVGSRSGLEASRLSQRIRELVVKCSSMKQQEASTSIEEI